MGIELYLLCFGVVESARYFVTCYIHLEFDVALVSGGPTSRRSFSDEIRVQLSRFAGMV